MMRFGTLKAGGPALVDDRGGVVPLDGQAAPIAVESVQDLIERMAELGPDLRALAAAPVDGRPPWIETTWAAPIPRPRRNLFCVGKNYHAHAVEFAASGYDTAANPDEAAPPHPVVFTKAPECVIGPDEAITASPALTREIDYEAVSAVVIGRGGRASPPDRAMDHVFGYTLLNDVTARDLQRQHRQWFLGKSIETFCPMGPLIAHHDGIDWRALELRCHVNDALRQQAVGAQLIFGVPDLIATISRSLAVLPGDIIATGTPAGVGIGLSPPRFLADGDVVSIHSEQLGTLSNPVRVAA